MKMTPQQYDELPSEIKAILDTFNEDLDHYSECERISQELKPYGYIADYGLSGVIDIWKVIDHKEVKSKDNFHSDCTYTYYEIADANWDMYHNQTFQSEQEAREVIEREYKNRSKNDGSDEYWRNRKQIVIKVTYKKQVLG